MEPQLENGTTVKTPNGKGTIVGLLHINGQLSVIVTHAWLRETNPPACFAYPIEQIEILNFADMLVERLR